LDISRKTGRFNTFRPEFYFKCYKDKDQIKGKARPRTDQEGPE